MNEILMILEFCMVFYLGLVCAVAIAITGCFVLFLLFLLCLNQA